jgi:hypothetical protein
MGYQGTLAKGAVHPPFQQPCHQLDSPARSSAKLVAAQRIWGVYLARSSDRVNEHQEVVAGLNFTPEFNCIPNVK